MNKEDRFFRRTAKDFEILKAPEGFTQRVMNRVSTEQAPVSLSSRYAIKTTAVWVFLSLFAVLILISLLFSGTSPEGGSFFGLNFSVPSISEWLDRLMHPLSRINVSPVMIIGSILILLTLYLIDEYILKKVYK